MSLMKKLFRAGDTKAPGGASQFEESRGLTTLEQTRSRNAPHRDLVKVVLRETMRRNGIPLDWIECRTLSALTRQHKQGMHVQFLVLKADHQLLQWVHAFQESFWDQILRTDPTAREWLFSVGWEFYGKAVQGFSVMPDPRSWKPESGTEFSDTQPPETGAPLGPGEDDDLATDLQALQAVMSVPAELHEKLPDAAPRKHKPL